MNDGKWRGKDAIIGRRGRATRERIFDAMLEMLKTTAWTKISVPGVCRIAGMSASNFYQFFPNLDAAAFELRDYVRAKSEGVPRHLVLVLRLLEFERNLETES